MTSPNRDILPLPVRRGLSKEQAADYVGLSVSAFERMVKAGELPVAKRWGGRIVWDRVALDSRFTESFTPVVEVPKWGPLPR